VAYGRGAIGRSLPAGGRHQLGGGTLLLKPWNGGI
jgi:hypothetical protein